MNMFGPVLRTAIAIAMVWVILMPVGVDKDKTISIKPNGAQVGADVQLYIRIAMKKRQILCTSDNRKPLHYIAMMLLLAK